MEIDNQQHKETKMKPQVKASITLPFAVLLIILVGYLLATHPIIFGWMVVIPSLLGLLGVVWYFLFSLFGGKD
jgi:fatty acid desaturase